jgi:hypothetical protein
LGLRTLLGVRRIRPLRPCSELYYDLTPEHGNPEQISRMTHIGFYNLVFMG